MILFIYSIRITKNYLFICCGKFTIIIYGTVQDGFCVYVRVCVCGRGGVTSDN